MQSSLYIVSTPIGNLGDFSTRGIKVLKQVDIILCEDTRITNILLNSIDIRKRLIVYNDHNAEEIIPKIIHNILNNNTVYALVSDAGTPLISDPGYKLVNACINNHIEYTAIPGPSAVINALVLSGFPSNKFLFGGFVDPKEFEELSKVYSTIILYESPNRIINTLKQMMEYFNDRTIAIVREMTKVFEEVKRGPLDYLIKYFSDNTPKGEFVIVISPPVRQQNQDLIKLNSYLDLINLVIDKVQIKDLSRILSGQTGISKNFIYNYIKGLENNKS